MNLKLCQEFSEVMAHVSYSHYSLNSSRGIYKDHRGVLQGLFRGIWRFLDYDSRAQAGFRLFPGGSGTDVHLKQEDQPLNRRL